MADFKMKLWQKITLIVFGIIIASVILECLLRICGYVTLLSRQQTNHSAVANTKTYTVLCLGDSFTYGAGAARGGDYPHQLKDILSKAYKGNNFDVINKGVPGSNSSELLYSLRRYLDIYRPDLVVVLTGMNDGWNIHMHNWAYGKRGWKGSIQIWFSGLRLVKLYRLLKEASVKGVVKEGHINEEIQVERKAKQVDVNKQMWIRSLLVNAEDLLKQGRYNDAHELLMRLAKMDNWSAFNMAVKYNDQDSIEEISKKDSWLLDSLAKQYQREGKSTEALGMFKAALKNDPGSIYIRFDLAEFYLGLKKYQDFTAVLKEVIDMEGESPKVNYLLARYYKEIGDNEKLSAIKPKLAMRKQITNNNIAQIQAVAHNEGINLIIMSYPEYENFDMPIINNSFFVDNLRVFKELKDKRKEFFSGDNHHCNEYGYAVIALNVFDCMVKNHLIEEN